MVAGIATMKVTITLSERQLQEVRRRLAADECASISGFIQDAVQKSLDNAAEFRGMVEQGLKESGGPLTSKERQWARRMLSPRKRLATARTVE
jgi:Arc/MetJ-type ribon-helix-helix transcriptional regulator